MKLRKLWFAFIVMVLVISSSQPVFAASSAAPLVQGSAAQVIPNRYIVVFKDGVSENTIDATLTQVKHGQGAVEHYRYRSTVKGFAATLPAAALAALRNNPNVSMSRKIR